MFDYRALHPLICPVPRNDLAGAAETVANCAQLLQLLSTFFAVDSGIACGLSDSMASAMYRQLDSIAGLLEMTSEGLSKQAGGR